MEHDFNPLESQRDAADFMRTLGHLNNQQRQNALLEEQVRLQREANELKKKELAMEQERMKLGREQTRQENSTTTNQNKPMGFFCSSVTAQYQAMMEAERQAKRAERLRK